MDIEVKLLFTAICCVTIGAAVLAVAAFGEFTVPYEKRSEEAKVLGTFSLVVIVCVTIMLNLI